MSQTALFPCQDRWWPLAGKSVLGTYSVAEHRSGGVREWKWSTRSRPIPSPLSSHFLAADRPKCDVPHCAPYFSNAIFYAMLSRTGWYRAADDFVQATFITERGGRHEHSSTDLTPLDAVEQSRGAARALPRQGQVKAKTLCVRALLCCR